MLRISTQRPLRLLLVFFLATKMADAEDWPQFRGPSGDGHSQEIGIPLTWDAENSIRWKTALPGQGWSSPVVVGAKVFLTAAIPGQAEGDFTLAAICVDAKTGDIVWNRAVFQQLESNAPEIHKKNSHASPTPIFDKGKLFVHFGHMGTACLDPTGEIIWRTSELTYEPVHGNGGSPILVGDHLIFSCDGEDMQIVAALHRATGEVVWKTDRKTKAKKPFSFCTAELIEVDGRQQIISPGSNCVVSLDPKTGAEFWRVRYDGYSVIPRPVFGNGLIYIGTGYDRPSVLAIRPGESGDVTEDNIKWSHKKGAPNTPSFLLVDDLLFMVSDRGIATCIDANSGDQHWQKRLGGNFSASPVLAEGRIYFTSEEGVTTVIEAANEYNELAKNDIGQRTLASMALSDKSIFLRTDTHLYRIGK